MNCYRVLLIDWRGVFFWPIIVARDETHAVKKAETIYPKAETMDVRMTHPTTVVHRRVRGRDGRWSAYHEAEPVVV